MSTSAARRASRRLLGLAPRSSSPPPGTLVDECINWLLSELSWHAFVSSAHFCCGLFSDSVAESPANAVLHLYVALPDFVPCPWLPSFQFLDLHSFVIVSRLSQRPTDTVTQCIILTIVRFQNGFGPIVKAKKPRLPQLQYLFVASLNLSTKASKSAKKPYFLSFQKIS